MWPKEARAVQDDIAGSQGHQDNPVQSTPIKVSANKEMQTNMGIQDLENLTEFL